MKHVKHFETYIPDDKELNYLEKGDYIIFIDTSSKLKTNQKYIINSILKFHTNGDFEVDKIKDGDFITIKDLNNDIILTRTGEPMLFYPHRFESEVKFNSKKYNL